MKKKAEARTENLKVRITRQEALLLKEKAGKENKNLSEYIRGRIFLDAPELLYQESIQKADQRAAELVFQIRKLGINLNQIAHRMNADMERTGDVKRILLLEQTIYQEIQKGFSDLAGILKNLEKGRGGDPVGGYKADVSETGKEWKDRTTP